MTANRPSIIRRLVAILFQRCPQCLKGRVYHGFVSMYDACLTCSLHFGHEPGYFTGAMYASYAIAVPALMLIFLILWHFFSSTWTLLFNLIVTGVLFLPLTPIIFRYSRVIWMPY